MPAAGDSALAVLATVASHHGLPLSLEQIRALTRDAGDDFNLTWVLIAARLLGFETVPLAGEYDQLDEVDRPNILLLRNPEGTQRFVVLFEIDPGSVVLGDPTHGRVERIPRDEFVSQWTGDCVSLSPQPVELSRTRERLERFGNPWLRLKEALNPARTVIFKFKGLPPENEGGDRYQALSTAVQAAQNPELASLGQLHGLLVVDNVERVGSASAIE